jgi:hypothetical protein
MIARAIVPAKRPRRIQPRIPIDSLVAPVGPGGVVADVPEHVASSPEAGVDR